MNLLYELINSFPQFFSPKVFAVIQKSATFAVPNKKGLTGNGVKAGRREVQSAGEIVKERAPYGVI